MQRMLLGRLFAALGAGLLLLIAVSLYLVHLGELGGGLADARHQLPFSPSSYSSPATKNTPQLLVPLNPEVHRSRPNTTIYLDWIITKGFRFPDGVQKCVYLVNSQFPGPNVEARSGDSLVIDVHNQLGDEGLALHFHGLRMAGANHMDGVVGITQRAIPPGGNFTYTVPVSPDQAGTFWWHAHSELMRADGLYGGVVIHAPGGEEKPPNPVSQDDYEDDMLLLIGDWYHQTAKEVQATYDTWTNWGMEPSPDSLLINGVGSFNCSRSPRLKTSQCMSLRKPELRPRGRKSRVRIINVGSMSGISLKLPGERINILTVDGGNPVEVSEHSVSSVGILHPGERVDVSINWAAPFVAENPQDYLEIVLDREYYKKKNLALVTEQRFPVVHDDSADSRATRGQGEGYIGRNYDLQKAQGQNYTSGTFQNSAPDQNVLVYTKIELLAHLENRPKGYINHTYWVPPQIPLINSPRTDWDAHQLVPLVKKNTWVDIVINNVDEKGHPFHLHGYDFFVLSRFEPDIPFGWHAHNPFDQLKEAAGGPYNLLNPLKKDTVHVPAAGYVVLRIKADNPGLWFLHCHVLWHHGVGMAMTLQVGE